MQGINWLDLFRAADHFLLSLVQNNGSLAYAVLFTIFFCETGVVFMAFLPGDSLVFVTGAVSATGSLDIVAAVAAMLVGAVGGNAANYALGTWLGRKIYDGSIGWIDRGALMRTHNFFERHGGKTVVLARFVPVVRTFAPLVAGASTMDSRRFHAFNVVGALAWVVLFAGAGYLFGNVPLVRDHLGVVLIVGLAAALGPVLLATAVRLVRGRSVG
ncbi:MAG TPA: VTT domain-containing protein [Burkholderiaceae bacterium]|nr:VTT domain-containing protein [Burkholderiaceae bacterium]